MIQKNVFLEALILLQRYLNERRTHYKAWKETGSIFLEAIKNIKQDIYSNTTIEITQQKHQQHHHHLCLQLALLSMRKAHRSITLSKRPNTIFADNINKNFIIPLQLEIQHLEEMQVEEPKFEALTQDRVENEGLGLSMEHILWYQRYQTSIDITKLDEDQVMDDKSARDL